MGFLGLEQPTHILLILVVILLLFGARRIPELAKSLGKGVNEFKSGLNSKDEPAEEKHPEAVEERRAEAAAEEPAAGDGHRREEAAHAEGSQASK